MVNLFKKFNKNASIQNRVFLGFGGVIVGIVLIATVTIISLNKVSSNFEKIRSF